MISEKKLAYYEYVAESTCSQECQKIIAQLVSEVRRYNLLQRQFDEYQKQFADTLENLVQTRREADWLAEKCAMLDDDFSGINANGYREFARRSVQND